VVTEGTSGFGTGVPSAFPLCGGPPVSRP